MRFLPVYRVLSVACLLAVTSAPVHAGFTITGTGGGASTPIPSLDQLSRPGPAPVAPPQFNAPQDSTGGGFTPAPAMQYEAVPSGSAPDDMSTYAPPMHSPANPVNAPIDDLPRDPALPLAYVPSVPMQMQGGEPMNTLAPAVQTFTARRGEDLYTVLRRWAAAAGQPMTYATATRAYLKADYTFTGNLETAVDGLLDANPQAGLHRQASW